MELALIPNQECKSVIDNIIDNIYLGNFQSHKNFNGSIINLSDYDYTINDKYNLLRINISDSRDANENIAHYFTKCIDFIETNKNDNILHRPKRKMRQKLTPFFDNVIAPLQA
jgi:hypothetical protein